MSGVQLRAGIDARGSHPAEMVPGVEYPSVTFSLSEPADSTARWLIRVEAKMATTRVVLGSILTISPAAGANPNRVVALAVVPGAIGWMFQASLLRGTGNDLSEAWLDIASSMCCGTPGLVPNFSELVEGGSDLIQRTVIFNGALPAAGAFTNPPLIAIPSNTRKITYWITYTRGAAGGFPAFRAQWSNGVEESTEAVQDLSSLVVAQPFGSVNFYQQELIGPAPANANPIIYPLTYEPPTGVTGLRLLAAERGVPANPGILNIALTGSV